jgi:hypothetical protein
MVSVSLETGELVFVDEHGDVFPGTSPPPGADRSPSPRTGLVDGAIASASMPGIFPARRLGPHMCVDGGVREVVPVVTAVEQLGCNQVIAIRVSAPVPPLPLDQSRIVPTIVARSLFDITFDEVADDDVEPYSGWGQNTVTTISATLNLHDTLVVEPGLIRIAIDYGWMRASDVFDPPTDRHAYAFELSDQITRLRCLNWKNAHWAAGAQWIDPNRSLDSALTSGQTSLPEYHYSAVQTGSAVRAIRNTCVEIHRLLQHRQSIGAPIPPGASAWYREWEELGRPVDPHSTARPMPATPWDQFVMKDETVAPASPPPVLL